MNKCAVRSVSGRCGRSMAVIKMADHSIAAADHSIAAAEHSRAMDHSIAGTEHSRAMDHSIAGTERRTPGMVRREGSRVSRRHVLSEVRLGEVRLPEVYSAEVHPPEVRLSERNEKSQSLSRSVRRPFATTPGARHDGRHHEARATIQAVCPNWARTDLCGGRSVMSVPTAMSEMSWQNIPLKGRIDLLVLMILLPPR